MYNDNPVSPLETPRPVEEPRHNPTRALVPGLILIVLGAIFLLNNLTGFVVHNWWALFFLIPAFGAFGRAWNEYNHSGSLSRATRQSGFGGLLLSMLAAIFLFQLSWALFGPVLLILLGLTLLGNEFLP